MRSPMLMSALVFAILIASCTPQGSDVVQKTVDKDANTSTAEPTLAAPSNTPSPAVTSTKQVKATMTVAASPTPSQPPVATKATATPSPTQTATPVPTHTPTAAPTALATPGAARSNTEGVANSDALSEQGIQVYQEQYCGICHQLNAAGTAGLFGPTHNGLAQTAEQRLRDPHYTGEATTAGEYIRESILSPKQYVVKGYEQSQHHMPAYTNLSETDLEALVQLLLQQK